MRFRTTLTILALACGSAGLAQAAITPEKAKELGAALTAIGAEKAGNKDGSIPAYAGGLTTPPASYKPGEGIRPDPFAGEKSLFSVDANNMAGHEAKLTDGAKALMKKYPGFRIDVYPTHRTAAFPKSIEENTAKCAVTASTVDGGRSMEGCRAGFPFPIPKDGYEAMWNHLVRFNGVAYSVRYRNWNVDSTGRPMLSTEGTNTQEFPYWNPNDSESEVIYRQRITYTGPARRAGEGLLIVDPLDTGKGRRAWSYLPGQRRVKVAPDLAHDTPNPGTSGATTFDDTYIFNGSMERFDFKLLGKREMYIPYNAYRMAYHSKAADLLQPKFLNPDLVRWELHRVWVVEATLSDGKRHVYSKRTFYLDEDSWAAVASDEYDGRGELYRAGFAYVTPSYEVPAPVSNVHGHYDFVAGAYSLTAYTSETGGFRYSEPLPSRHWTPDSLAGTGIR
jgi:hypothetical protein